MKQKASGKRIARVMGMAIKSEHREDPYVKLWMAVIENALMEAEKTRRHSEEARRFLSSDGFDTILNLLGINPDYAHELIRDHATWH